jgi:hypothetical protein
MRFATLLCWLVTASLGGFMLHTWLARGGLDRERAKQGGLPPQLIFGHAAAAITGLLVWVVFLVSGARPLAWAAVGLLMIAVGLGLCTVTLWTPYPAHKPGERRSAVAPKPTVPSAGVEAPPLAEEPPVAETAGPVPVRDGLRPSQPPEFTVTDEMIAQLMANPAPLRRPSPIRPNPAVLVPVAHGFAAIGTFVLAVTSAIR